MEPSYITLFEIGRLFIAKWITSVSHKKGFFFAWRGDRAFSVLKDFGRRIEG